MTNNEWLVKTRKLKIFLRGIFESVCSDDYENHLEDFGLHVDTGIISDQVTEWLQAEHPITTYIKLSDVEDVMNGALKELGVHSDASTYLDEVQKRLLKKEKMEVPNAEIH